MHTYINILMHFIFEVGIEKFHKIAFTPIIYTQPKENLGLPKFTFFKTNILTKFFKCFFILFFYLQSVKKTF